MNLQIIPGMTNRTNGKLQYTSTYIICEMYIYICRIASDPSMLSIFIQIGSQITRLYGEWNWIQNVHEFIATQSIIRSKKRDSYQ